MVVSVFKNHYLILQFFNENDEDIVLNNSDFLLLIETLNTFCFEFFDVGKYLMTSVNLHRQKNQKTKNKKIPISKVI